MLANSSSGPPSDAAPASHVCHFLLVLGIAVAYTRAKRISRVILDNHFMHFGSTEYSSSAQQCLFFVLRKVIFLFFVTKNGTCSSKSIEFV